MNEPDPEPNLRAWAEAELGRLPVPKAPTGLVPAVLEQLRNRGTRSWWVSVWWEWPVVAKVASVLLAASLMGAFVGGAFLMDQPVAAYSEQVTERLSPLAALAGIVATLWHAMVMVGMQPLVLAVILTASAGYLLCVGLGTILVRSIWKRA